MTTDIFDTCSYDSQDISSGEYSFEKWRSLLNEDYSVIGPLAAQFYT